jgi:hypothetical protein
MFSLCDSIWHRMDEDRAARLERNQRRAEWVRATAPQVCTGRQCGYLFGVMAGTVRSIYTDVGLAAISRLRHALYTQRSQGMEVPE